MGLGKTLTMISLILKCKETVFSGDKNKKKREEIEDSDEENDPEAIGYHSKRKSECKYLKKCTEGSTGMTCVKETYNC